MPVPPDNPTNFTITRHPQVVILWINLLGYGWAETYWLWPCQHDFALELGALIAEYRSWLLCQGCEICYAAVRTYNDPPDQQACIGAPIFDSGRWGVCHTPQDAVLFTPRTADGKWGFRYLHGLEDAEVTGGGWQFAPLDGLAGPIGPPPNPLTAPKEDLYRFFLRFVRDYTCKISTASTAEDDHPLYKIQSWDRLNFTKRLTQDLGVAYARASWQGLVYAQSPPMSPCGEPVTALRACYASDVRFYANSAQVDQILYYWAKPDATFFQAKTIFWGWRADNRVTSPAAGPGELVSHRSYAFAPGDTWSDPPGDHFCGGVNDFLGLAVRTWPDGDDTPPELLCECDMIVPLPIKFRLSDNSVVQLNTQIATFDVADFDAEEVGPNEFVIHAKCGCDEFCTGTCSYWSTDLPFPSGNTHSIKWHRLGVGDPDFLIRVPGNFASAKFSCTGWFKTEVADTFGLTPFYAVEGTNNFALSFAANPVASALTFLFGDVASTFHTCTAPMPALAAGWHMFGFAFDASRALHDQMHCYLDGVYYANSIESLWNGLYPSTPFEQIDLAKWFGNPGEGLWSDDYRFEEGVFRDASYFSASYATPAGAPASSHHWQMNEGQGVLVGDSGTVPMPGYIPGCFTQNPCLPTGQAKYGATILNGKVVGLGQPITEIVGGTI